MEEVGGTAPLSCLGQPVDGGRPVLPGGKCRGSFRGEMTHSGVDIVKRRRFVGLRGFGERGWAVEERDFKIISHFEHVKMCE